MLKSYAVSPFHKVASAAYRKGSAGPVRWRRENETLYNIGRKRPSHPSCNRFDKSGL